MNEHDALAERFSIRFNRKNYPAKQNDASNKGGAHRAALCSLYHDHNCSEIRYIIQYNQSVPNIHLYQHTLLFLTIQRTSNVSK